MKLRIKGDSIRLRLLRPEVAELITSGVVAESTRFPAGTCLRCELRTDAQASALDASFESGVLTVSVPQAQARDWSRSNEVSIRAAVAIPGGTLQILVEKDFPCLVERPLEDDSGAFDRDRLRVDE